MAHTNAWGSKFHFGSKNVNVNHHYSNFGRSPVSIICAKIRAQGLFGSGEGRFLMVITIYRHGSHFDQWPMPILVLFHSPSQGFEQHWLHRSHLKLSTFFPYKRMGPIQMHTEANVTSL